MLALTQAMLDEVGRISSVVSVEPNLDVYPPDYPDSYLSLFPFTENSGWTRDYYGPLWITSQVRLWLSHLRTFLFTRGSSLPTKGMS